MNAWKLIYLMIDLTFYTIRAKCHYYFTCILYVAGFLIACSCAHYSEQFVKIFFISQTSASLVVHQCKCLDMKFRAIGKVVFDLSYDEDSC
jgi:hypothetical protein